MQEVHRTLDLQEAQILVGLLRTEGIPAWVVNDRQICLNWLHILALGGFRVQVATRWRDQAASIVDDWQSGTYALHSEADSACPKCQYTGHQADPTPPGFAILLAWLGLPLYWPRRRRRCNNCAHRWQEANQPYTTLAAAAEKHETND